MLGYNPIVGGRFYGLGNQGAAIFIVSLFILLGLVVSRLRAARRTRAVVLVPAVVGLLAVFVSGNPSWGAKFGGTIATLAGLLVLLALVSRIRLSLFRLGLIGLASLGVLLGIAFLDWPRPAGGRSHFGNFFDQLVTGEALQVVGRKLGANLHIIQINPALAIVTPLAIIAILLFLRYLLHFPASAGGPTARCSTTGRGAFPPSSPTRTSTRDSSPRSPVSPSGSSSPTPASPCPRPGRWSSFPISSLSAPTVASAVPSRTSPRTVRTAAPPPAGSDPLAELRTVAPV